MSALPGIKQTGKTNKKCHFLFRRSTDGGTSLSLRSPAHSRRGLRWKGSADYGGRRGKPLRTASLNNRQQGTVSWKRIRFGKEYRQYRCEEITVKLKTRHYQMQQRFIRFFLRQTLQGDPTTAPQANRTILNFPRVHSVATSGRAQAWWRPAIGGGQGRSYVVASSGCGHPAAGGII